MRYNWEPNDQQHWEMSQEAQWMESMQSNYKLLCAGDLVRLNKHSYPQYAEKTGIILQSAGEGYWEIFIDGCSHPYRISDADIAEVV